MQRGPLRLDRSMLGKEPDSGQLCQTTMASMRGCKTEHKKPLVPQVAVMENEVNSQVLC